MNEVDISVCIPTYEMHGEAVKMLTRNFNKLIEQKHKSFEVIIADNSEDDVVRNFCLKPEYQTLHINYFKNPIKGLSPNANAAMKAARGKIIKILHMDDYLADENSLFDIVNNFTGKWLVTGCGHDTGDGKIVNPHYPKYNNKIFLGKNTIGSPSVLSIINKDILLFDDKLSWLNDCDYYKRMYDKYGEPVILNKVNAVIGIGKHQTTSNIANKSKWNEKKYLNEKYFNEITIVDKFKEKIQNILDVLR